MIILPEQLCLHLVNNRKALLTLNLYCDEKDTTPKPWPINLVISPFINFQHVIYTYTFDSLVDDICCNSVSWYIRNFSNLFLHKAKML